MSASKVELSHLDKVLFPEAGITKGDLVDHYSRVAARMLPQLHDRPIAIARYPNGIHESSFFQQSAPAHTPAWVKLATVPKEGGEITHMLCQDEDTLRYLANQAAITLHMWLSRVDLPDRPDQVLFDLDPPSHDFGQARHAALALRDLLDSLELPSLVKTTGGRGLHVSVPVARRQDVDELREFARGVADVLVAREPDRFTTEIRKNKRGGRLFLDTTRNAYAQLVVAPYTVRAVPEARVATPLDWSELDDGDLRPDRFTVHSIESRLADDDPWRNPPAPVTSLRKARDTLAELAG